MKELDGSSIRMVDLISLQTTVVCVEYIFYLLRMEMALHEASLTQTES